MAFTGFFLITFLIVHATVNSCIFLNDNGETFNAVAHFLSHNWIVRFLEVGLFVGLILHIIQGLIVWKQNSAARSVGYHTKKNKGSTWYSRSMGILGTLLLFFLIMHISHFFIGTKVALYSGDREHNLYNEMQEVFSHWWIVLLYIFGVTALFWHLLHGFQSAFQTFGWNHRRHTPVVKMIGVGYSVIICILFALMPVAMYFKWID
jgi:succinate dehydrogenase / fumarate reductase cytochrome b subunit